MTELLVASEVIPLPFLGVAVPMYWDINVWCASSFTLCSFCADGVDFCGLTEVSFKGLREISSFAIGLYLGYGESTIELTITPSTIISLMKPTTGNSR